MQDRGVRDENVPRRAVGERTTLCMDPWSWGKQVAAADLIGGGSDRTNQGIILLDRQAATTAAQG